MKPGTVTSPATPETVIAVSGLVQVEAEQRRIRGRDDRQLRPRVEQKMQLRNTESAINQAHMGRERAGTFGDQVTRIFIGGLAKGIQ